MTFYVGQKVVCVDDEPSLRRDKKWLNAGKVYSVRAVEMFDHPIQGRYLGLHLFEVPRPQAPFGFVVPWDSRRFRPAVQPKTDISIFERILDHAVSGEPVDA